MAQVDPRNVDFSKRSSIHQGGKNSPANCKHIVNCLNHNTNVNPPYELRNPTNTYDNSTTNKSTQTILNSCAGHTDRRSGVSLQLVKQGDLVSAAVIQNLITVILNEFNTRGISYSPVSLPEPNTLTRAQIITNINNLLRNAGFAVNGNNPTQSKLMVANDDPNPAINAINSLTTECMCYTDCGSFKVCSCHGYCNDY